MPEIVVFGGVWGDSIFGIAGECQEQGRRDRGSRVSGCSPNFWGRGAVLPQKFVNVTD